jgi:hypothetical protein
MDRNTQLPEIWAMPLVPPLKKLVVEWRYKANLRFFGKMDETALELVDDFPHWERSPLTVEVRNRQKHRRLFLSVHRSFFEVDDADPNADFSVVEKLLKKTCSKMEIRSLQRLGIRQWFVANLEQPFALLVDEIKAKFLSQDKMLSGILSDKVLDVSYVVDFETNDGAKYNLRLGPMTKKQWFEMIRHEPQLFEPPAESSEKTFEQYEAVFPENFLYIDIDCFKEDCPVDKIESQVQTFRRRSHEMAQKLIDYCKKATP